MIEDDEVVGLLTGEPLVQQMLRMESRDAMQAVG